MAKKIKPCPFCGWPAAIQRNRNNPAYRKVCCTNADCLADRWLLNEDMAVKEWNNRSRPKKEDDNGRMK